MRVLRSSLFVAATAIIAAACGDKVTVPAQTTTAAKINSVQVAPSTASITVGQSITLTAAVNADAGLTTTTTWSTSSAAAATVTQAGVVTGVASSPGVAICASVTAAGANTVQNCASVSVSPIAVVVPATVQITSVTTANLNTPAPVPPGVVAGQINVSVTANPGTARLDSVVVFLNGIPAGTQTLTAAQAAALRAAAEAAVAEQQVVAPIVFSINTAAYNTTTGAVTYLNGPLTISAVAYGHQGASASQNAASQSVSYLLGNVDGFQVSTVNNGNSAVDATGFAWQGHGTLTIKAIPVMYSGKTVGTVTASLGAGTAPCVAGVGAGGSTTTPAAGVWSVTLALAAAQSPVGCTTTTPNVPVITALDNAGNVLTLVANGTVNTQAGIRWDNVAPAIPAGSTNTAIRLNVNPNGRSSGWINDAVLFNTTTGSGGTAAIIAAAVASNGFICGSVTANTCLATDTLPRDAGVGGATLSVQVGATKAAALTAAPLTNPTSLAASLTNTSYCAVAYSTDLLGNKTADPAGAACGAETSNTLIGVDRAPPTIAYTAASLAANARQGGANIGGDFIVTVTDTGVVGNSGMLPVNPVLMQLSRRVAGAANSAGTISARNADNSAATTAGVLSATGVAVATPVYSTSIAASVVTGYYTHLATAYDAAGNSTAIAGRTIVYDAPAPTVSAAAVPLTVSALGWSASAFVNDVLDIQTQWFSGDYTTLNGVGAFTTGPSAAPVRFAQAQSAVNGFNAATFINTNVALSQAINLPLAAQANNAATLYPLATVEANAINQGNLTTTGAAAGPAIPAQTAITTGGATGMTAFATPTFSVASNTISSGVTTAATVANPASGTLTITTTGLTATFVNPFSRIDIYGASTPLGVAAGAATPTEWRLLGSIPASAATLVDNGATRVFTYTISLSGASLYTTLGLSATTTQNITALGFNAAGTVAMTTGVYSLTVVK